MNSRRLGAILGLGIILSAAPVVHAASNTGQVIGIINNYLTTDNFAVALKAGWSGPGCGGFTDRTQPLIVIYLRDGSPSQAAYERSYAALLAASFLDSSTELTTYGNSCEGYGLALSPIR